MFSASSEARDRNAPTNANQIRLQTSRIRQEHRPIRYQLPARLSFRQGQVHDRSYRDWNQRALIVVEYGLQRSLSRYNNLAAELSQQLKAFSPLSFNATTEAEQVYCIH
jgi:hypothetical protein